MGTEIPAAFNVFSVLLFFIALLGLLHLLLVFQRPLDSIGWKKVDYIWVSLSILGVIAAISSLRQEVARNMADEFAHAVHVDTVLVANALQAGTFCRPFSRTAASPPEPEFTRLVKEEAEICAWFAAAKSKYDGLIKENKPITMESLGGPVPGKPDDFRTQPLQTYLAWLNENKASEQKLRQESHPKDWEGYLRLLGPWLLAAAIALRLTKITGEIKIERDKKAKTSEEMLGSQQVKEA